MLVVYTIQSLTYTLIGACILYLGESLLHELTCTHVCMNITLVILFHVASSEVQRFQSSLATTGRRHPCRGEQLMITCEVVGSRLDWRVDSIHRARYFDTNRVDEVRTVNGPSIKFRTILTGNEEVTGTMGSSRRLTSTLIAELSQTSTSPHNVSCSSDLETRLLQFQIAGNISTKCQDGMSSYATVTSIPIIQKDQDNQKVLQSLHI